MGGILGGSGDGGGPRPGEGEAASNAQKANISDPSAIKAVLDLATIHVMRERYEEDHLHSNLKLGLGFLACLVGVSAYLYPVPFPKNKWFLKWCVILYFVFSTVMQAITVVFFRDLVFVTKGKKYPTGKDHFYIRVVSRLPRYHTMYKLTLTAVLNDAPSRVEREIDIQEHFDVEGYFDQEKYCKVVEGMLSDALAAVGKKDK
eukprot:CAMPEP_0114509606 /NCGR_PEP_ID=MMETSP0109-20121206/13304_1 /TAXON_ID=29199 /ORGANISM="Chlorarachnion reptans, Strain CCCM449" /LENGTH=202 /DNA_ID=CAMNT_0001688779 /DNA_START=156 /DNA_END=764 /DNA_ORIENTATION=-